MWRQPGAKSPHEAYYYYWAQELQAVRSGTWKLQLPHKYVTPHPAGGGGKPGQYDTNHMVVSLFDLSKDIGEKHDVAAAHPDIVARLQALAEQARTDLGDSLTKRIGKNARPAGKLEEARH
jgi:hypothetical protein